MIENTGSYRGDCISSVILLAAARMGARLEGLFGLIYASAEDDCLIVHRLDAGRSV